MTVIVDASVALKWVLEEDGTDAARRLAATEIMAAPELLFVECASALRTKTRFRQLDPADSRTALAALEGMSLRSIPIRPHVAAAHALALELDSSAYDALYLAVALAERSTLVTADSRFATTVHAHPVYRSSLRILGGN